MTNLDLHRQVQELSRKVESIQFALTKSSDIPKKEWYRPTEICKLAGISRTKFEYLKRSGYIKTHKSQGVVYVSHQELEKIYKPSI